MAASLLSTFWKKQVSHKSKSMHEKHLNRIQVMKGFTVACARWQLSHIASCICFALSLCDIMKSNPNTKAFHHSKICNRNSPKFLEHCISHEHIN